MTSCFCLGGTLGFHNTSPSVTGCAFLLASHHCSLPDVAGVTSPALSFGAPPQCCSGNVTFCSVWPTHLHFFFFWWSLWLIGSCRIFCQCSLFYVLFWATRRWRFVWETYRWKLGALVRGLFFVYTMLFRTGVQSSYCCLRCGSWFSVSGPSILVLA